MRLLMTVSGRLTASLHGSQLQSVPHATLLNGQQEGAGDTAEERKVQSCTLQSGAGPAHGLLGTGHAATKYWKHMWG